jgi:hypothetical protein
VQPGPVRTRRRRACRRHDRVARGSASTRDGSIQFARTRPSSRRHPLPIRDSPAAATGGVEQDRVLVIPSRCPRLRVRA